MGQVGSVRGEPRRPTEAKAVHTPSRRLLGTESGAGWGHSKRRRQLRLQKGRCGGTIQEAVGPGSAADPPGSDNGRGRGSRCSPEARLCPPRPNGLESGQEYRRENQGIQGKT